MSHKSFNVHKASSQGRAMSFQEHFVQPQGFFMSDKSEKMHALSTAIAAADLRVLLMVLVHLTGDLRWLDAPYLPKRDIRLIPDADAGLPPAIQDEIRKAAVEVLSRNTPAVIVDPGDTLMQRMMSVSLGESVPAEYAPLNREEMGLISRQVQWPESAARSPEQQSVLIVGAGVCGIALAANLERMGIPFTVLEKHGDVGGTWYTNRYPGCGVDTPNHSYSYSFGPRFKWPRYFSRREDVQRYVAEVVDSLAIRNRIRFNTELLSAHWDEELKHWRATVRTPDGVEELVTNFLVTAIGQLSDPTIPQINGASSFTGLSFHSSVWPDGLSVAGKRIAVIGTGATAMQLVPEIVDIAQSITVYQRTAQWSRPIPGYSDPISAEAQWLLTHVPFYAEWFRFNMFWRYGDGLLKFLRKDPDWPHPERSINKVNDRHRQEMLDFMHSELGNRTDLVEKCTPTYPPYGKRILLDNRWFQTLKNPKVELVTQPIQKIVPTGIEASDGIREADIIVYSTGFRVTEMAARLGIEGIGGVRLADVWSNDNPSAYLGLAVPKFPNFFTMLGPGSGPGHGGSAVFQAECQARYITSAMAQMADAEADAIEVKAEILEDFLRKFDAEHEALIWTHPGMSTYYRNSAGRVFSVMPWRFVDYWVMTHDAELSDYLVSRVNSDESVPQ
ncbi:NAD(P)-binding domain-containing protein [Variovorax sp. VNK109]|uniref:NAD(P)/FAD-dependent oxidoreductase n=1 Tax=Variovorax sp. VNK109 TaxID=3400919 RepID=UPI003C066673